MDFFAEGQIVADYTFEESGAKAGDEAIFSHFILQNIINFIYYFLNFGYCFSKIS